MVPIKEHEILKESIALMEIKLAKKLTLANKKLALKNYKIEKSAKKLTLANNQLSLLYKERGNLIAELIVANKKLIFKTQEVQIETAKLNIANRELKKAEESQKEYINGLEEMMFLTSHKVRQPVANILGLSDILGQSICSSEDFKQSLHCIKQSAITLDVFTRELTNIICELGQKNKNHQQYYSDIKGL